MPLWYSEIIYRSWRGSRGATKPRAYVTSSACCSAFKQWSSQCASLITIDLSGKTDCIPILYVLLDHCQSNDYVAGITMNNGKLVPYQFLSPSFCDTDNPCYWHRAHVLCGVSPVIAQLWPLLASPTFRYDLTIIRKQWRVVYAGFIGAWMWCRIWLQENFFVSVQICK
jgi:hypothetical protein